MLDRLHLHLFGSPQFTYQGKPITGLASAKARALLIYLAVTDRTHSRDDLAELLWADKASTRRGNLKKVLNQLRNHERIPLREEGQQWVALDRDRCWVDVGEFEQLVNGGDSVEEVDVLQRTVDLYRGDFLADFNTSLSVEFEAWALGEQTRIKEQMVTVLCRLTDGYAARNELTLAIGATRQLLLLEPWSEETHRQLIELLALSGDRSAALKQFEQCRQILAAELDVEPGAATIELVATIRSGVFEARLDHSSHTLGRSALAQLAEASQHNLPASTTPFIGREQELAELARLLGNPDVRLTTILGAGGMGKTRLALEAASALRDAYAHGVHLVPLAPLSEPETMVSAIAASVGYTFQNNGRSAKEQLLDHLRQRKMLLLLDNAEHLLAGVTLFTEILQAAPAVCLLVTSRERLRLSSETVYGLEGLAVPDGEYDQDHERTHDKSSTALQLFLQSAKRVRPSFVPTAADWPAMVELCRLVGGMPLGLILAASWIEVLAPVELVIEINHSLDFLAADLHDLPKRHRSLRVIFDTTWRQLTKDERNAFQKLSVFRGGFTREAAQSVAGASLPILTALSHKSLIQTDPDRRYEIHELLRQFALETLAAQVSEMRDVHSAFYCAFLAQREFDLKGVRQQVAMAKIAADGENVRAAWRWAVQRSRFEALAQALDGLCLFYLRQSLLYEGESMCRLVVDLLTMLSPNDKSDAEVGDSTAGRRSIQARLGVRVHIWLSSFQRHLKQPETAQQALSHAQEWLADASLVGLDTRLEHAQLLLEEAESVSEISSEKAADLVEQCLDICRTLNDCWLMARGLDLLGRIFQSFGHLEHAWRSADDGLILRQTLRDARGVAESYKNLSIIAQKMGKFDEAGELIRQSITIFTELNDRGKQAMATHTLASILVHGGQFAESFALLEESVSLYLGLDLPGEPGGSSIVSGFALMHMGRYEEALHLYRRAIALYSATRIGYPMKDWGRTALAGGSYREAESHLLEALLSFRNSGDMNGLGQTLGCLGYVALRLRNLSQARHYIRENLQIAAETRLFLPSMTAISGVALLRAEEGAGEAAIELYTVALQNKHVANSRWYHDAVGRYIDPIAETLPTEVVEAAQARGRERDWWSTVPKLFATWNENS